jgi:glutamine cyclotransferase
MAILLAALAAPQLRAAAATLEPQTPVALPGAAGSFDWLAPDMANHRIFASHPGAKGVVVIDTQTGTASELSVGVEVNGVAISKKAGEVYFAGGGQKVLVYDAQSLAKKKEISLDGPADTISLNSDTGLLYVDEDEGKQVWVVDPAAGKVVGSVAIAGVPEFVAYDRRTAKLYQNVKTTDSVQVIDPATNAVVATWPTLPAKSPHGLAIDGKGGRLFIGGKNGQLAVLDIKTGSVIASAEIAPGVDQVSYDAKSRHVYCAGGGFVSVVDVTVGSVKLIEKIPVAAKAHTLAVDTASGDVWIAYPDGDKSYVERLKATAVREATAK